MEEEEETAMIGPHEEEADEGLVEQEVDPNESIELIKEALKLSKAPKVKNILKEVMMKQKQLAEKLRQIEQTQQLQAQQNMPQYVLYETSTGSLTPVVQGQTEFHIQSAAGTYPVIVQSTHSGQTTTVSHASTSQEHYEAEFAHPEAYQEIHIDSHVAHDPNQQRIITDATWLPSTTLESQGHSISPSRVHETIVPESYSEMQPSAESGMEEAILIATSENATSLETDPNPTALSLSLMRRAPQTYAQWKKRFGDSVIAVLMSDFKQQRLRSFLKHGLISSYRRRITTPTKKIEVRYACNDQACNNRMFKTHQSCFRHLAKKHLNLHPHSCAICNKCFMTRRELFCHQAQHDKSSAKYKCDHLGCDYATNRSDSLNEHKRKHSAEKGYMCDHPNCDRAFKQRHNFVAHKMLHEMPGREFQCPKCPKKFSRPAYVNVHLRTHNAKPYKCPEEECKFAAANQMRLNQHIERIHNSNLEFQCGLCGNCFPSRKALKEHKTIHGPGLNKRPRLEAQDIQNKAANEQVSQQHLNEDQDQAISELISRASYHQTHEVSTPISKVNRVSLGETSNESGRIVFTCQYAGCGRSFSSRWALSDHENVHSGTKPYVCPTCSQQFHTKKHLRDHESVHSKRHVCDVEGCGKAFNRPFKLKEHHKLCHANLPRSSTHSDMAGSLEQGISDDENYRCPDCDMMFPSKSRLWDHRIKHTKPHRCDVCGFATTRPYKLKRHKLSAHGLGQTSNDTISDASNNVKNDSPNRRGIKQASTMGAGDEPMTFDPSSESVAGFSRDIQQQGNKRSSARLEKTAVLNEDNLDLVCDSCSKSFPSRKSLQEHKKTHQYPHVCQVEGCGYGASRPQRLSTHMKRVHGLDSSGQSDMESEILPHSEANEEEAENEEEVMQFETTTEDLSTEKKSEEGMRRRTRRAAGL